MNIPHPTNLLAIIVQKNHLSNVHDGMINQQHYHPPQQWQSHLYIYISLVFPTGGKMIFHYHFDYNLLLFMCRHLTKDSSLCITMCLCLRNCLTSRENLRYFVAVNYSYEIDGCGVTCKL